MNPGTPVSTTVLNQHIGYQARPLACRNASRDELKAYSNALKERGKGAIEIALTQKVSVLTDDEEDLLAFLLALLVGIALIARANAPTIPSIAPAGTHAVTSTRPPGRTTRSSSPTVRSASAAKITPKTESATSNSPSANGSASTSPATKLASGTREAFLAAARGVKARATGAKK